MSAKQDRVRARTPTDLERKYGIRKRFSEMASIADDNRDSIENMNSKFDATIESGTWKPTLNNDEVSCTVQQGWYQRIGRVVTVGWLIEAEVPDSAIVVQLAISGVPYIPLYDAFGIGVYIQDDNSVAKGWVVDSDGFITTAPLSLYPNSGAIKLSGTICYTT